MTKATTKRRDLGLGVLVPAVLIALTWVALDNSGSDQQSLPTPTNHAAAKAAVTFTADGDLVRPTGFRKWTYVGTPLTPNDMNGGKAPFPEFHSVYMNPNAYDHYEKTGEFPDGTVLVKELISVGTKEASSGNGYFMGEFIGLEVSLKDKTRYPDEPGNWAYFSFGHKYPLKEKAPAQATASCNECHDGEADDDYVFTQYYPVLRAAKGAAKDE